MLFTFVCSFIRLSICDQPIENQKEITTNNLQNDTYINATNTILLPESTATDAVPSLEQQALPLIIESPLESITAASNFPTQTQNTPMSATPPSQSSPTATATPSIAEVNSTFVYDPSQPAACIAALGSNQLPGGHTCHNTYNAGSPLAAGYGGCDYVKTSEGGIRDLDLVWQFAKSKGFMVKGGGNCFDVVELTFNGKSVSLVVVDNGTGNDVSIPAYAALTGVQPGPNCEGAVCPIGNVQSSVVGNCKQEFISYSKTYLAENYPSTVIELTY